ncbi:helix-turn-helix domain-containing protein [Amycolatopsis sp. H20-H5]|uniref:helix-turn-helix domain-containing protein n=1 Tax=Amycolatopsis sp. H20-H5 TaxID=3046309 RepID=UPI002DB9A9DF|nr:helix-turn-helix transcriptional regulator [Amycolatopsis sp. H20-H5]MEC3982466.1 helix-turn-helix transcriptional regulator [Amycolatopsis sp. H20-H5]
MLKEDGAAAMAQVARMQRQLRRIRKTQDLSLAQVAEQLQVHQVTVWRWENDVTYNPTLPHLQLYACLLGYTLRFVLTENEPRSV